VGRPWLSRYFIFIIIIQHNDAVSGGHGGNQSPRREEVLGNSEFLLEGDGVSD
jgi:hypothetical protein